MMSVLGRMRRRRRSEGLADVSLADSLRDLAVAEEPVPGVNLVGYLRGELGLGEVARKIARALEHAGIPFAEIDYGRTVSRREHPFEQRRPSEAIYDTNIICLNPRELRVLVDDIGLDLFARRYTIGVWFWETTRFPDSEEFAFHFVDEVWVASEFVRKSVAAATWKPVHVIPLPLDAPSAPAMSRDELGLPNDFLFLFTFDFQSAFERKNPLGLVEAFVSAFRPGEGPTLIIKTINGYRKPTAFATLQRAVRSRGDIKVVDRYVSVDELNALTASCDCYVSLHRSEGFGLTMAEAMLHGKPVIATGYSGNTEFMNEDNSYLVPYRLVEVPPNSAYPQGGSWAEPDTSAAAELMRRVYEQQDEARTKGESARRDVLQRFSIDRTATLIETLVKADRRMAAPDPFDSDVRLAVMRLAREVARGVGGGLTDRPPQRSIASLVRWFLVRALWPYLAEQQSVNAALLEGLAAVHRQSRGTSGSIARGADVTDQASTS